MNTTSSVSFAAPSATSTPREGFDLTTDTLIIGAGACGLVAALAAHEAGHDVLVVEADAIPSGSTALSAGLIPAAGTRLQKQANIEDSAALFAQDIQAKANAENRQELVDSLSTGACEVIHWLMEEHGLPFTLVNDFDYPGHSKRRMHALPTRSGTELINALRFACERVGIDIICHRRAQILHHDGLTLNGVTVIDPNGARESIGCIKLILACNGFGGNRELVSRYMPQIESGVWFGHDGNQGEAIQWADAIGARVRHPGAYQGHGNVAHPHGILITWATMTQGGYQVNAQGQRFWDESQGYSEAAQMVLAQTDGIAITLFDERIAQVARQFEDFKQAESTGAVQVCSSLDELARTFSLPLENLEQTVSGVAACHASGTHDVYGRQFNHQPLSPPYYAVRVTGALFHTQGGLDTDNEGRVLHTSGSSFHNLFAGGGAACGVSGKADTGYLSGNGLLSAVVMGMRAGKALVVNPQCCIT